MASVLENILYSIENKSDLEKTLDIHYLREINKELNRTKANERIQTLNLLFMIWKSIINNYLTPKEKFDPLLSEKIYLFMKEILLIFYDARYIHNNCSIDLGLYVLNLTALTLNHKLYQETFFLTKIKNWIFYISNENNDINSESTFNEELNNWFHEQFLEKNNKLLKLSEFENKLLFSRQDDIDFITNFIRKLKAWVAICAEKDIDEIMTILERLYILTGKLKIKSKDKLMSDLYSINFKIITEKSSNFENDLEILETFFEKLMSKKETYQIIFSFLNDLAYFLLKKQSNYQNAVLERVLFFIFDFIIKISQQNSFSIQNDKLLLDTFHLIFKIISKNNLSSCSILFLKMLLLNDSIKIKECRDISQASIENLMEENIPTNYFYIVHSYVALNELNSHFKKNDNNFLEKNNEFDELIKIIKIPLQNFGKVNVIFKEYYCVNYINKVVMKQLIDDSNIECFLIKIYNEIENFTYNFLFEKFERNKVLDFIENFVGMKSKKLNLNNNSNNYDNVIFYEMVSDLLKIENVLISLLINSDNKNIKVLKNFFYMIIIKIINYIKSLCSKVDHQLLFGEFVSITELYFNFLINIKSELKNQSNVPQSQLTYLIFISSNLLCNPSLKSFGLCLLNSYLRLLTFDSDFYIIISYKSISSSLSLISKILRENLEESEIAIINNTFLFTEITTPQSFNFNYFGFLKIITKIVSYFFEGNNPKYEEQNSKILSSLLESYFKLFYHLYMFSDKINVQNIIEFHETFIEKFMQEKNVIFFKFAIRETLQILIKVIQTEPEKSSHLINIMLCLNNLFQKQAFCYESYLKKINLSLYILEIIEYILSELERKKGTNFNEVAIVMRKFYLTNFQNFFNSSKKQNYDNHNELLINILESIYPLVLSDLPNLDKLAFSKTPKKTIKFVNLILNIISKLIISYISQIFNQKDKNFTEEFYNRTFKTYEKCLTLCNLIKKILGFILSDDFEYPLKYEIFYQKYLDPCCKFYDLFSNSILHSSTNKIRMFLKTLISISDILLYFNFPQISIICNQISLLIISTGRNLAYLDVNKATKDDNKTKDEKNLLNLLLQSRISSILQKLYFDYQRIGYEDCLNKISENLEKNFFSSFAETKKYMKILKQSPDAKNLNYILDDLKQNATVINVRHIISNIRTSNSMNLSSKINDLMNLLNKISKKNRIITYVVLKSEILLVLCKILKFYGLNSLAFALLNDYNLSESISLVCNFESREELNKENIQRCSYTITASKGMKDYLAYTKSRMLELRPMILKQEGKAYFIEKVIEKGIVFNHFWKVNSIISKTFKLYLEILNKNVGIYSYSKYYEILFLTFELKNLRIIEYFKLLNSSIHVLKEKEEKDSKFFDFQTIFDQIFVFAKNKTQDSNELYKVFFPKRRSLSTRISLSDMMGKIQKIFEENSNKILMKQIMNLFLDFFHYSFSNYNETKDLDLLLMKNVISKTQNLKTKLVFPLFSKSPCKLLEKFLISDGENCMLSKCCMNYQHNLYKLDKSILENDLIMLFLSKIVQKEEIEKKISKENLIKMINLRNLLFILTNEISTYDITLAYHYLYILYKYEANIFEQFGNLLKDNKADFIHFIESLGNIKTYECLCVVNYSENINKGDRISKKSKIQILYSMNAEIFTIMKFFNKPYDFKLFLKEYDMKNKSILSDNYEFKASDNLRKSLRNMHIMNKTDSKITKSIKLGLGINIPNNMNSRFVNNLIEKNAGKRCIIVLKYIEENNEKLLIVGRINMKKKSFLSYKIDSQHKLNFLKDYLYDFNQTIKKNEENLKNSKNSSENNLFVKEWWGNRKKYDKRIESLLNSIEETLDYLIYMMMGDIIDEKLENHLETETMKISNIITTELMRSGSLNKLFKKEQKAFMELIKQILSSHIFQKISDVKLKLMMEEIKSHYLLLQFIDGECMDRITNVMIEIKNNLNNFINKNKIYKRNSILLLLDETFQSVPIEYMPLFLDNNQCFYRIPSFTYLSQTDFSQKTYNFNNLYYVLNPQGDLIHSQNQFQTFLSKEWNGISGKMPSKESIIHVFENSDFYLYLGHGAGEDFFNEKDINNVKEIKPVVMLIGCSTNKQILEKERETILHNKLEMKGISLEYLLAKCPLLLGTLWDITDKDTDLMTEKMLKILKNSSNNIEVVEALINSRKCCRLKFLNGAAFVCYGIPIFFSNNIENKNNNV